MGEEFEPDLRDMLVTEMRFLYRRLNQEGYLCMDAAAVDLERRMWWFGRAAGLLDAMMILDGTWPGLDRGRLDDGRPKEGNGKDD